MTYRIDPERRRIVTRCTGETTLPEVLAHFDELERDARVPAGADVLLDFTRITSIPNVGQIQSAAHRAGNAAKKVRFGALAVVAQNEELFGIARLFEMFTQRVFTRSRVFADVQEAEAWLESPDAGPGPRRFER
ncbi:MAG TPA: hypothetical protein VGH97_14050 [Thermoanaerobaculia bacterium]